MSQFETGHERIARLELELEVGKAAFDSLREAQERIALLEKENKRLKLENAFLLDGKILWNKFSESLPEVDRWILLRKRPNENKDYEYVALRAWQKDSKKPGLKYYSFEFCRFMRVENDNEWRYIDET